MKVKKILIVPADRIVETGHKFYSGEFIFYSDIPKILGKDNTYVFGKYNNNLTKSNLPKNCPYPSCHGAPLPTFVDKSNISDVIKNVDVVLLSRLATTRGNIAKKLALKFNIPIALFDFADHETNYGSSDIIKNLCYGNILNKDYNIYFKKDLPLGYATDTIIPIAPVPVRPESFNFKNLEKQYSIFYSGRGNVSKSHPGYQKDRVQTVNLLKKIKNTKFVLHENTSLFMSTRDYWDYMSKSQFCLSPSGRVWDSFRHTETGLTPNTVLIAPKPFVHTTGPELKDGVNCILYDTKLIKGKYNLINEGELLDKINFYIKNKNEALKLSKQWAYDVNKGHTIYARSKYIIKTIEEKL